MLTNRQAIMDLGWEPDRDQSKNHETNSNSYDGGHIVVYPGRNLGSGVSQCYSKRRHFGSSYGDAQRCPNQCGRA
jgi:hypothetical protein